MPRAKLFLPAMIAVLLVTPTKAACASPSNEVLALAGTSNLGAEQKLQEEHHPNAEQKLQEGHHPHSKVPDWRELHPKPTVKAQISKHQTNGFRSWLFRPVINLQEQLLKLDSQMNGVEKQTFELRSVVSNFQTELGSTRSQIASLQTI